MGSESPNWMDKVLWVIAVAMIAGALGANYYFADQSLLLRVIGLLVSAALAVALLARTQLGNRGWTVWLESVQEVRKIHWPTRQETLQTTAIVLVMVFVMGLLLWSADFMLLRAVKWLTGRWGA